MNRKNLIILCTLIFILGLMEVEAQYTMIPEITKSFNIEVLQEDPMFNVSLEHLYNETFRITVEKGWDWKPGTKWSIAICNDTADVFQYNGYDLPVEYLDNGWCEETGNMGVILSGRSQKVFPYIAEFQIPENITRFTMYGGEGSFEILSYALASGSIGGNSYLFYSESNDRYYALTSNNIDFYLSLISAPLSNLSDWTSALDTEIYDADSFALGEFSGYMDNSQATSYLHIAHSDPNSQYLRYMRCEMTDSAPYFTCLSNETPWTASDANDDVAYPNIALDDDRCVYIAFDLEDDSETTTAEHGVYVIKEDSATTCGDGDFDSDDIDFEEALIGWPGGLYKNSVQLQFDYDSGYMDTFIVWDNPNGDADLLTKLLYKNGSLGVNHTLDADTEGGGAAISIECLLSDQDDKHCFAPDDNSNSIDVYNVLGFDSDLDSQVDTLLDADYDDSSQEQPVTAIRFINSTETDTQLYVFVSNYQTWDIGYASSVDQGSTWTQNGTLYDSSGLNYVFWLDSYYNEEYCDVVVAWYESTNKMYIQNLSLKDCVPEAGGCTPNLQNTSWSAWQNMTTCQITDLVLQNRSIVEYDANECGGANTTYWEYQNISCDYCQYSVANTSWENVSCWITDQMNQTRTEYDANYSTCYAVTNLAGDLWNSGLNNTYYQLTDTCNFCSYDNQNTSWSAWTNMTVCTDSLVLQNRSLTEYDANNATCYAVTGIASDAFNLGANLTHVEYQNASCSSAANDTCTYTSGDWNINCSDNCIINTSQDLGGNDLIIMGEGFTIFKDTVLNYGRFTLLGDGPANRCYVRME